jgi:hypothetical protein
MPCILGPAYHGGYTSDGRYILVIYEELDAMTILPVTAYEVPEPR